MAHSTIISHNKIRPFFKRKRNLHKKVSILYAFFWIMLNILFSLLYPISITTIHIENALSAVNASIAFALYYVYKTKISDILTIIYVIDAICNYHFGLLALEYYIALFVLHYFMSLPNYGIKYHLFWAYLTFITVLVSTKYLVYCIKTVI